MNIPLSSDSKFRIFITPVIESKELYPPLEDEIKDGQWMGVTVKSQKPGGKVLVSFDCSSLA